MTICMESCETSFEFTPKRFAEILEGLSSQGYSPLISQAKQKFMEVFSCT